MRILTTVFIALCVVACGDPGGSETAIAADDSAGDVDFCSCINEPLDTDAKLKVCDELRSAMTSNELVSRTFACRRALPVPEGGPDMCYCLRTTTTDPAIMEACQAVIPEEMTPQELTATMVACAQ